MSPCITLLLPFPRYHGDFFNTHSCLQQLTKKRQEIRHGSYSFSGYCRSVACSALASFRMKRRDGASFRVRGQLGWPSLLRQPHLVHQLSKGDQTGPSQASLQFRILGFRFFQDGDVGVGVFPEGEEFFVGGERFSGIARHHVGSAELKMGKSTDGIV